MSTPTTSTDPYITIRQLERKCAGRTRLAALTAAAGALAGFTAALIITMPPLWIGAL
ncbi:hypothetical protein ACWIB8_05280 [Corynebacterium flavescens]